MAGLPKKIAVVGLGYVGLPLAVSLARHFTVLGFDVDAGRVAEIANGTDRTREVDSEVLRNCEGLTVSAEQDDLAGCDFFIVTVPTPVDATKMPDLSLVKQASRVIGRYLEPGGVVVSSRERLPLLAQVG